MDKLKEERRDIEVITKEIHVLCSEAKRTMLLYAAEIGRRLVEAKEILPHGEWGGWLKEQCGFSQRTANKHMQIFKAYGSPQVSLLGAELNSPTWANLSYSQALSLLAVPDEEREEFVKAAHAEELSAREIDRLIKERDEAVGKAEAAERELQNTIEDTRELNARQRQLEAITEEQKAELEKARIAAKELTAKLDKAKENENAAKEKLKKLKESPEIPQELKDRLKADAAAEANERAAEEIKKGIEEAERKAHEAETARVLAESAAEAARSKAEELRKAVASADPAVSEFKILFTQVQETMDKMLDRMSRIGDSETAGKLAKAVKAVLDKYGVKIEQI